MPCVSTSRRRNLSCLAALLAVFLAAGCDLPRDPEGTLDRASQAPLRVGITVNEPWTAWEGDEPQGRPVGVEPELVERFAEELGTEVAWVRGSETELLTALENFDLDLVVGGLKDDTLWADRVGLSRTYVETADGKHVIAAPPGENAFLLRLDKFLARQEGKVQARLAEEGPVTEKATVE